MCQILGVQTERCGTSYDCAIHSVNRWGFRQIGVAQAMTLLSTVSTSGGLGENFFTTYDSAIHSVNLWGLDRRKVTSYDSAIHSVNLWGFRQKKSHKL